MFKDKFGFTLFTITTVVVISIGGCTSNQVTQSEYSALSVKYESVLLERDLLLTEIQDLESKLSVLSQSLVKEPVSMKLVGGFVATVRDVIPDYVLDDETLQVAILTEFQSPPFTVYVGEKIGSQLEIGKTYYFHVAEQTIVDFPESEFKNGFLSVETWLSLYNLRIESVREPKDNESGLSSPQLNFICLSE